MSRHSQRHDPKLTLPEVPNTQPENTQSRCLRRLILNRLKTQNGKPSPPSLVRCLEGTRRVTRKTTKDFAEDLYVDEVPPDSALHFGNYSFGVHKALDKAGAVFGPLAAYGLLRWLGESASAYRMLFWVAFCPAVLSVVVLAMMKDQPGTAHQRESVSVNWQALSPEFKRFLVPAGVFALGYYSLGFLLLKAHAVGFSLTDTVLLYALFNGVCVFTAPLVGRLGDLIGRSRIVLLGYCLYGLINLALIWTSLSWQITALFALYGVFFAIDESQSKAFIADLEPERRATAVGAYNFLTGLLYLPASLIAGSLWAVDSRWAFGLATLLAFVAMVLFVAAMPSTANLRSKVSVPASLP